MNLILSKSGRSLVCH